MPADKAISQCMHWPAQQLTLARSVARQLNADHLDMGPTKPGARHTKRAHKSALMSSCPLAQWARATSAVPSRLWKVPTDVVVTLFCCLRHSPNDSRMYNAHYPGKLTHFSRLSNGERSQLNRQDIMSIRQCRCEPLYHIYALP